MHKHDAGPWKLSKDSSGALYHYHISTSDDKGIVVVSRGMNEGLLSDRSNIDADAKLISKAPEMYELLQRCKKAIDENVIVVDEEIVNPILEGISEIEAVIEYG